MSVSRRNLLKNISVGLGAAALAGCAVSTVNGVTTIKLNVSEVVSDTDIAMDVAKTALGFTGVPAGVVTIVNDGVTLIQTGLTAFKNSSGSSLTLTFDCTSVPAAFTSLIKDIRTVAANISAVAKSEGTNISSAVLSKVSTVSADVGNVADILESIVSVVSDASRVGAEQSRTLRLNAIKARHGLA